MTNDSGTPGAIIAPATQFALVPFMGLRTGFRTFNSLKTLLPGKGVPQIGTDEENSFAPFTEAASDTILIRDPTEFADIRVVETPEPRSWQTTTNTLSTARARTCRRAREPLRGRWP